MESPSGRILQTWSAGQYLDAEPEEELLELLELLEELLELDEEFEDELLALLAAELLLDEEDELLLELLVDVLPLIAPPQPVSMAQIETR